MNFKTIFRDQIAFLTAKIMRRLAFDPRYFDLWQKHKFHVLPVHFYSPIPNTLEIDPKGFEADASLAGISMNEDNQIRLLEEVCTSFRHEYEDFVQRTLCAEGDKFAFGNISFESVDAEMLYCMTRRYKPSRFVEIGSGFTRTYPKTSRMRRRAQAR
jgi:hypothetical protein